MFAGLVVYVSSQLFNPDDEFDVWLLVLYFGAISRCKAIDWSRESFVAHLTFTSMWTKLNDRRAEANCMSRLTTRHNRTCSLERGSRTRAERRPNVCLWAGGKQPSTFKPF